MTKYHPTEPAKLSWREQVPTSCEFDDVYFNSDGGLDETRYVFLEANGLPQRWQNRKRFVIGETGFGTGLNFLATVALWLETAPADAKLHYVSVEKFPLTQIDLEKALRAWPQLNPLSDELISSYPSLSHGYHQRQLFNNRVTLTLMLGDADEMYRELQAKIDAWYLDGFAPGKNPGMWTDKLFKQLARLSHQETTISTFTAAGVVRRGLQNSGFEINKLPGFGKKREMIHGQFKGEEKQTSAYPWFSLNNLTSAKEKTAVIIGAGLAGCSTAYALAKRGWQITLIERHSEIAQEASGNHTGVVLPRLTADMSAEGRFYLTAFLDAVQRLDQLKTNEPGLSWHRSGVVQILEETQLEKLSALKLPTEIFTALNEVSASALSGTKLDSSAAHYSKGGWLSPPEFCRHLLGLCEDKVNLIREHEAISLTRIDGWQVNSSQGVITTAEVAILANGYDAARFSSEAFSLQKVRGQLTYLDSTPKSRNLKTPVCYEGYVVPVYKDQHTTGATYDLSNESLTLRTDEQEEIINSLKVALPDFDIGEVSGGRAAFRTSSLDHLPLVGPVADEAFFKQHYADLKHGKAAHYFDEAVYQPSLFVTTGHGSRGLVSCPISAELIASMLNDEPLPLPTDLINAIHPARFLVRSLRKGKA